MDITDPASPLVQAALQWSCDICQAPKGQLCRNTILDEPLPGRVVHLGRLVDRRRERKEKE